MLRGSYTARIDEKGRLKLPTPFKAEVEERHGTSLFVTSVDGECVLIYPMPVWEAHEQRLLQIPGTDPTLARYLRLVNFHGQQNEFDSQGRVVIQTRLRESAAIVGDVSVVARVDYFEVWNFDRLKAKVDQEKFTNDDARVLAQYGV